MNPTDAIAPDQTDTETPADDNNTHEIRIVLPPYDSCAHCKCFGMLENQPNGLPPDAIAGICRRYPPTVQLRPQQVQSSLIGGPGPNAPQIVMVPTGYFPPVLSTMPACGEFRMRIGLKKKEKKRLRAV